MQILNYVAYYMAGVGVYCVIRYWMERKNREIQSRREQFLVACLAIADKYPGGKEFVTIPYNMFCRGAWIEEYSKHYPRKEYRQSVGVMESN